LLNCLTACAAYDEYASALFVVRLDIARKQLLRKPERFFRVISALLGVAACATYCTYFSAPLLERLDLTRNLRPRKPERVLRDLFVELPHSLCGVR